MEDQDNGRSCVTQSSMDVFIVKAPSESFSTNTNFFLHKEKLRLLSGPTDWYGGRDKQPESTAGNESLVQMLFHQSYVIAGSRL